MKHYLLVLLLSVTCTCDESTSDPNAQIEIIDNVDYLQLDARAAASTSWITDPARQSGVTAKNEPYLNQPCDHFLYKEFNKAASLLRGSPTPYHQVIGIQFEDHPQGPKVMDPKELCIRTDENKNIDINEFDCLLDKLNNTQVSGYCSCGSRWSRIDLNDAHSNLGLNPTSLSYEYFEYVGLDKFLIMEKQDGEIERYECVAHRFGHCTLNPEERMKNKSHVITKCKKGYKCRNVSVWAPIQKSAIKTYTGEWYGICISEPTPDGLHDPFGSAAKHTAHLNSLLCATTGIVIVLFICHEYEWGFDNNYHKIDSHRINKYRSKLTG